MITSIEQYPKLLSSLQNLSEPVRIAHLRNLFRTDLYFLLRYGFARPDVQHPWLFDRCREVQQSPDGYLDLWSREHYKSTIITYAKTIQDILASHGDDPLPEWAGKEITVGIFAHTRPIAKAFLKQIMREFEYNETLKTVFPDILYAEPTREAPIWSADSGIVVKRKSNPKESTVEAWGIVEGQPISKHFNLLVYDDLVTRESVSSPEMTQKTTEMWELSLNLGAGEDCRKRYIGTRYHLNDTYRVMLDRGAAIARIHPATDTGEMDGEPVYWSKDHYESKVREMGTYTASTQLLQNPLADRAKGFKECDLRYYDRMGGMGRGNRYILVDPANEKRKKSDYTSIFVVEACGDRNLYLVDMLRDKLNLNERTDALMHLHRTWHNSAGKVKAVLYEQYGLQSDIQHIEYIQADQNYRFDITPVGGSMSKVDRILRLQPIIEANRLWLPKTLPYRQLWDGRLVDMVEAFISEEFETFPVSLRDDMLDCLSRICDVDIIWPKLIEIADKKRYASRNSTSYQMGG